MTYLLSMNTIACLYCAFKNYNDTIFICIICFFNLLFLRLYKVYSSCILYGLTCNVQKRENTIDSK